MPALSHRPLLKLQVGPSSHAPSTYAQPCSRYLIAIVLTLTPPHLLPALALPFPSPTHLSAFVSNSLSLLLSFPPCNIRLVLIRSPYSQHMCPALIGLKTGLSCFIGYPYLTCLDSPFSPGSSFCFRLRLPVPTPSHLRLEDFAHR